MNKTTDLAKILSWRGTLYIKKYNIDVIGLLHLPSYILDFSYPKPKLVSHQKWVIIFL